MFGLCVCFFFSSRRRHTRWTGDWSSDVCSSDLAYSKKCKRRVLGISPEARSSLQAYDWPGNVRELENAVERAVVLGSTELITVDDLPEALLETGLPSLSPAGYYEAIKEAKKRLIIKALEESQGNYTAAAKQLGVHPNNLHRLVHNLDLKAATGK